MDTRNEWAAARDEYLQHLRAGGSPNTTMNTRWQHLDHAAARIPVGPWDVNGDLLTAYFAAQEWQPETRRGRRSTFRAFYGHAVARGVLHTNPADALPPVKPAQPHPRPAPDAVLEVALAASRPRERLMLRLAAELGLRRAEVAAVHARDIITMDGGDWITVHGKGRKDRTLPLRPEFAATLRDAAAGDFLFPGSDAGHLSPRWVGKLMAQAMPGGWTMHTLRHRFGTRAYALDRDLLTVQALLGHANPTTTRLYVRLPDEALRSVVDRLAAA